MEVLAFTYLLWILISGGWGSAAIVWSLVSARQGVATRVGIAIGVFLGFGTTVGLALARMGWWSPEVMAGAFTILPILGWQMRRRLICRAARGAATCGPGSRDGWPVVAAVLLAMGFAILWSAFPHEDLFGERDGGTYMAAAAELARSGSLGWRDPLASQYGLAQTYQNFEYLGLVFNHYPRFLIYPGFYLQEPELRIVPQFLGGYEPWLALALRTVGEGGMYRTNAILMALGLVVFFCALSRYASWPVGLLGMVVLGSCLATNWHARATGNEALTFGLIWSAILMHGVVVSGRRRAELGWLVLIPALGLGLLKLAGWFVLPLLALDLAYRAGRCPEIRPAAVRGLLALACAAGLSAAHAAAACSLYLYGSHIHTTARLGIPYWMVASGLPMLVAGATGAGWMLGRSRLVGRVTGWLRSWSGWSIALVVGGVLIGGRLLLIIQRSRMAEIDSIWSNAANLAELANYIPTGLSLVGLAGLVWLGLSRRGPMRGGVLLVAFIGIFLLANRNLDAVHPWASRRWVPVLIPAVCAGVAFFVWRGLQIARSLGMLPGRGTVLALFWVCGVVIVGLVSRPSWPLVSSRSGRGLERAHESLAELIGPDAVVFAIPSTNVRRWLPWQLGRYGIAGYVLDSDTNAWSRMLPVFRDLVSRGKRVIYLTDDVPAKETTESGLLRLVGQRDLNWAMQDETLWSLPTQGPTEYSQRIYAYEVTTAGRSLRGWSPSRLEARGAKSPWAGEWPMFLGSDMLGSALVGFAGRASLAHRLGFEDAIWLGKRNRIYLDELLKAQSEQPEPGPKVIGYEVVLPMHSGPARGHGVKVQVLRDLSPTRTMDLVWAGVVGEEWTTVIVRLGADRLQAESALEIQSLRPPLGNEIPGGQVGALIGPIQIRPITIAR